MLYNEDMIEVTNPDLENGYITLTKVVKPDALPVDNITKFAYTDDDYIEVQMYIRRDSGVQQMQSVDDIYDQLKKTDYEVLSYVEQMLTCSSVAEVSELIASWQPLASELVARRSELRQQLHNIKNS